jgi:hypothetical protein
MARYNKDITPPTGWRVLKCGEPIPERHRFFVEHRGWSTEKIAKTALTPATAIATGQVIAYAALSEMRHPNNPKCSCSCNHISEGCYNELSEQIKQRDKLIGWQYSVIETLVEAMNQTSKGMDAINKYLEISLKTKY